MQKLLLKLFGILYLLALTAPFVFADTTQTLKMCSTDGNKALSYTESSVTTTASVTTTDEEGNEITSNISTIDQDKKNQYISAWEEEYDASLETYQKTLSESTNKCGKEVNGTTGFLEKGDCTKEGQIITELSEFTRDLKTGLGEDNFVTTVYSGTCCLIGMEATDGKLVCDDVRTIYTLDYASCQTAASDCQKRTWVIGTAGTDLLKLTVKYIYGWASGIVGIIAVITIVYNGVKISVSGISGDISSAKDKILQAVTAIVLLFLSGLILYTINPTFFG